MPAIPSFKHSLFLEGPAGVGKTSAALDYVKSLLTSGVPGESILVCLPDKNYIRRIQAAFSSSAYPDIYTPNVFYQDVLRQVLTDIKSLMGAPASASDLQFIDDSMARHYLLKIADPYIESGLFQGIRLSKLRIVNQVFRLRQQTLLNKMSVEDALHRLTEAAPNRKFYPRIYETIGQILAGYETFCREKALLDTVAQQVLFAQHVLEMPDYQEAFAARYSHIVADNIEEMSELDHRFLTQALEQSENVLLIFDQDAGYREVSGANPANAIRLRKRCDARQTWTDYVQHSTGSKAFIESVASKYGLDDSVESQLTHFSLPSGSYDFIQCNYYPQMVSACLNEIKALLKDKSLSSGSIAILVPYLTDSLELVLKTGFENIGVTQFTFASPQQLNRDQFVRAILTVIALVDSDLPRSSRADVAHLLYHLINGLDPLRADLLAQHAYKGMLLSYDNVSHRFQERITAPVGQSYEKFRLWLQENTAFAQTVSASRFLETLFNDFLNQPDYKFNHDANLQHIGGQLIERAQQLEQSLGAQPASAGTSPIASFYEFIKNDITAESIIPNTPNALLISDPYTLLCQNQTFDYQLWLDISHPLWSRRPDRELSNPAVLSSKNPASFSDEDVVNKLQTDQLRSTLLGLLRRSLKKTYLFTYGNQNLESNRLIFDLLGKLQKRSITPS